MNQCVVPSWDLDENSAPARLTVSAPSNSTSSLPPHVPSLEYEVAELTWENGQLAMHGLGPPRAINKPASSTWEKPRAGAGTLESIVNQATRHPQHKSAAAAADGGSGDNVYELVPWFEHHRAVVNPAAALTMTMDALVPNNNNNNNNKKKKKQENSGHVMEPAVPGIGPCMVGSCGGASTVDGRAATRRGKCGCRTNGSVSESATCGGGRDSSRQVTVDTCERELGAAAGFTSTSMWSPENTSSGGRKYTRTSADDHDHSVCHSRSQREECDHDEGKRKSVGKSSISTKRSRAAAIHNQSERKRRDKINQRMKTLQKLVPNCSKTDKASMLDEVIEYLKQLQAQVQMMSRMNMPSMMLPLALQQLQMSMMAPAMGMGMGMGVMDINSIGRASAGMPPVIPPASAFMPMPSWDVQADRLPSPMVMPNDILSALLACQSQQPTTMDAYSRLAALYQQFQQPPGSGSKN